MLDLSNAFAGEVEDIADVFERDSAAVGDVEGASFRHFPDFEVGEIHLNRSGLWNDIEVEMVFARNPRARARCVSAFAARSRSELFERLKDELRFFGLFFGEPANGERFRAS